MVLCSQTTTKLNDTEAAVAGESNSLNSDILLE